MLPAPFKTKFGLVAGLASCIAAVGFSFKLFQSPAVVIKSHPNSPLPNQATAPEEKQVFTQEQTRAYQMAFVSRINLALEQSELEEAKSLLDELRQLPSSEPSIQLTMARLYWDGLEDKENAKKILMNLVAAKPSMEEAVFDLALAFEKTESIEQGSQYFESLPVEDKASPLIKYARARMEFNQANYDSVLAVLKRVDPGQGRLNKAIPQLLADSYLALQEYDDALEQLLIMLDNSKESTEKVEVLRQMIEVQINQKQWSETLPLIQQLLEMAPQDSWAKEQQLKIRIEQQSQVRRPNKDTP